MKYLKLGFFAFFVTVISISCNRREENKNTFNYDDMMIRIAKLEIDSTYLDEYVSILKEEAEASVRVEPGVISIFPMFQKEDSTEIRIMEIYANEEAYESHLQTPHFKKYKKKTGEMVKSLKLIDMQAIDAETMPQIFKKLDQYKTKD